MHCFIDTNATHFEISTHVINMLLVFHDLDREDTVRNLRFTGNNRITDECFIIFVNN